jgi:hypothetical protein
MLWRIRRRPLTQKHHLSVSDSVLVREAFLPMWSLRTRAYTLPPASSSSRRHPEPMVKLGRRFTLPASHPRPPSPAAACKPRREPGRQPQRSVRMPSTGATVHVRQRSSALPIAVWSVSALGTCGLASAGGGAGCGAPYAGHLG